MRRGFLSLAGAVAWLVANDAARACDLCGCYTPQIEAAPQADSSAPLGQTTSPSSGNASWTRGLYGAVAEQFTYFGTLQLDGDEIPNTTDQHLDSSITQLVGGYTINRWLAAQLNVPLIYRSFARPEGFRIDRGTEAGLGDISLLGKIVLFHQERGASRSLNFDDPKSPRFETHEPDFTASGLLLAGVKLPTGATRRLKEEFNEIELPGAAASGIHGHDLTLGTGSYDGIVGGETSLRYKSAFFQADAQFVLRGDGAHQYHFANDLSWRGGPGYYFIRQRDTIVGAQLVVSGEYKDVDRFGGKRAEDTGITSVYVGPRVLVSYGKLSGEFAAELPVSIDNTALQVVPDYRVRGSFGFRF